MNVKSRTMTLAQIEIYISPIIETAGLTAILSFILMHFYLLNLKIISIASFFDPMWLKTAFIYRDYTNKIKGKTGWLYFVFLSSTTLLIPFFVIEIFIFSYDAPRPIFLVICFSVALLGSIVGYLVMKLSREKYY